MLVTKPSFHLCGKALEIKIGTSLTAFFPCELVPLHPQIMEPTKLHYELKTIIAISGNTPLHSTKLHYAGNTLPFLFSLQNNPKPPPLFTPGTKHKWLEEILEVFRMPSQDPDALAFVFIGVRCPPLAGKVSPHALSFSLLQLSFGI